LDVEPIERYAYATPANVPNNNWIIYPVANMRPNSKIYRTSIGKNYALMIW